MRDAFNKLASPMIWAGLLTWLGVLLLSERTPAMIGLLMLWLVGYLFAAFCESSTRTRYAGMAVQAASSLAMLAVASNVGMVPVLQVVLTAQLAFVSPLAATIAIALLMTALQYWILSYRWGTAGAAMLGYAGFQLFAIMTAHYARTAEAATQRLAVVNADLMATRSLLEQSVRSGERLRVARDLHDVVGHKLTALRLNLRALSAQDERLTTAQQLSAEILADIRGVVSSMRDPDGMDIATAIRAVAHAFVRPRLDLRIDDGLVIDDSAQAEAILRLVQESITNAAKHGQATTLLVTLARGQDLRLTVDDDGSLPHTFAEGNGLTGIRERIAALNGQVAFARSPLGGLRIEATLP